MKLRTVSAALALVALSLVTPTPGSAQVTGSAYTVMTQGDVLSGFIGPFRPCGVGMSVFAAPSCGNFEGTDISYLAVCYDTATHAKAPLNVIARIPDGSGLNTLRTLSTTAVVDACAAAGVTVPRLAVVLPAVQLGQ